MRVHTKEDRKKERERPLCAHLGVWIVLYHIAPLQKFMGEETVHGR